MEKLFIICPFAQLEQKLKIKYRGNPYFITLLGGFILDNIEAIKISIERYDINEIVLVTDLNCFFADAIIQKKQLHGLNYEKYLEGIYIEHFNHYFEDQKMNIQKYNLLKLYLISQLSTLENTFQLNESIKNIKGLIFNHTNYLFETIENTNNLIKQ